MYFFCRVVAMPLHASVYMCQVVTRWERTDLLALVCGVLLWVCYFPIGILGQVWCLIVSVPDLCTLTYFQQSKRDWNIEFHPQKCKAHLIMKSMIGYDLYNTRTHIPREVILLSNWE